MRAPIWVALLVILGVALPVQAVDPARPKVLVLAADGDPTAARIRAELTLIGFAVVAVTGDSSGELSRLARAHGALAAARVVEQPPEVLLWIDSAQPGQQGLPSTLTVSDELQGAAEPEMLALRAVELLRGRLVPVVERDPPATSRTPSTSTPHDEVRPTPPRDRRASIGLAPAIAASPGGVPVVPMIGLAGRYRAIWRLGVEAHAFIPTIAATLYESEGNVDLRSLALGGGATLLITPPDDAFLVMTGVGLDAVGVFYAGEPIPPYAADSGSRWSAAPYANLGIGYRVLPWLALRADAQVSLLLPRQIVRIAGRETASYGWPLVLGALSVEVWP